MNKSLFAVVTVNAFAETVAQNAPVALVALDTMTVRTITLPGNVTTVDVPDPPAHPTNTCVKLPIAGTRVGLNAV